MICYLESFISMSHFHRLCMCYTYSLTKVSIYRMCFHSLYPPKYIKNIEDRIQLVLAVWLQNLIQECDLVSVLVKFAYP